MKRRKVRALNDLKKKKAAIKKQTKQNKNLRENVPGAYFTRIKALGQEQVGVASLAGQG